MAISTQDFTFPVGTRYTLAMASPDVEEKNARILNMVVILIWLEVFLIIILGIVFPLIYLDSIKKVYLREQGVTASVCAAYIREYISEREKILSVSASMDFMHDPSLRDPVNPDLKGLAEDELTVQRRYFQNIVDRFPSLRFFAFLTPDTVRPIFLQPYSFQASLTREQYEGGYAYRDWAKKTVANYSAWDRRGSLKPHIAAPFISQPGAVPAIALSVAVVGDSGQMDGILYANMSLDSLSEYVQSLTHGKTGKVYLVDSAGLLLAHPNIAPGVEKKDESGNSVWELRDFSENPMVSRALKGVFEPGMYRVQPTKSLVISTYQVVPELGWIIILEEDVLDAFSGVSLFAYAIISLVLISIGVSFTTFFYISRETAESAKQHRELVVISETDPLTGLLNRRSMLSRMSQLISDAKRSSQSFVLAMFDIDDFKQVNDTYGHVFGDIVLREIAARTVSILRVEDLLFRWGGEEFLLIVKNSDLVRGRGVAEKIRRVVCDTPISDGSISLTVTVTIGVCRYQGGTIDSLIIRADEALYEGKRTGKNKIVIGRDDDQKL